LTATSSAPSRPRPASTALRKIKSMAALLLSQSRHETVAASAQAA
jgi:hypothetical protein